MIYVVTPYKGADKPLQECIKSVERQTVESKHIIIEDVESKGACFNHFEALKGIPESTENIVVHLDGDDMLLEDTALERILKAYRDPSCWVTYGNYVSRLPSVCKPINPSISFRDSIIRGGWCWSHLRTFRANTKHLLLEKDMKDSSGNWYTSAPDVAIFLPILEMAGKSRVRFIDEDLVYYRHHPANEASTQKGLQDQVRCAMDIYQKPSYTLQ